MDRMYGVYHCYYDFEKDDPPMIEDLICCFDSLEKAEEFKEKYFCSIGDLEVRELPTTYNEEYFWWSNGDIDNGL